MTNARITSRTAHVRDSRGNVVPVIRIYANGKLISSIIIDQTDDGLDVTTTTAHEATRLFVSHHTEDELLHG